MLIVTGANGTLGPMVVEQLLTRVPASNIGVSVRDPSKATALAARGVRVRQGDFDDPASLPVAFEGATHVLIISAASVGEVALRRHKAAIDAAAGAGARRIVYTSHMGANPSSLFPPMVTHAATEEMLMNSGVPFVSLRNGFYASTVQRMVGPALQSGTLVAPADGAVSWTTHADLAEAAAIVLAEPDRMHEITPPLTARGAYDLADAARLLSEKTGQTIERVIADDAEFEKTIPEPYRAIAMGMYRASRNNEFIQMDDALEKLLGRPAQTLRDVLLASN